MEVLNSYADGMERLLAAMNRLHRALGKEKPVADLPGYTEMLGRIARLRAFDDQAFLLGCLYGPSGSGKSTLFNLLTGLGVPAGNLRRPTTCNVMLAVPDGFEDPARIGELFEGYRPRVLKDPETLTDADLPADTLFYKTYSTESSGRLACFLVDVPDFDTVAVTNWDKARAIMRRADILLFVVYPEAYKNREVVRQLQNCSHSAARLAYIFQKVDDAEHARGLHRLLMKDLREAAEFEAFRRERRQDGRTLAEFLSESPYYFSPYGRPPQLGDLKPIHNDTPDLLDLLRGYKAEEIILEGVREAAFAGCASARELVAEQRRALQVHLDTIEQTETLVTHHANRVAGSVFPAGKLLALVIDVARESRPGWLRTLSRPVSWMSKGMTGLLAQVKQRFQKEKDAYRDRSELERERLAQETELLAQALRADVDRPEITVTRCREAIEAYLSEPPPAAGKEWESSVREAAEEWVKARRWRSLTIGTLNDCLVILGGAAVGVDLLLEGGIFTGSVIAAYGSGVVGTGVLMKIIEEFGLRRVLEKADAAWTEQRRGEIRDDLLKRFCGPLFLDAVRAEAERLEDADADGCQETCAVLETLGKQSPKEARGKDQSK